MKHHLPNGSWIEVIKTTMGNEPVSETDEFDHTANPGKKVICGATHMPCSMCKPVCNHRKEIEYVGRTF